VADLPPRAQTRRAARTIRHRDISPSMTAPRSSARGAERGGAPCRPDVLHGEQFPGRPSQERSRRARELLLAAALSRFAEQGYEATTVDEITKQAGVAVGAFYCHFRSKRQAMLVLMDRLLEELDRTAAPAPDDGPTSLMERLRSHLRIDWSYVYRAWREAALRDTALAVLHGEIEAWTANRIAAALRAASAVPATWRPADVDMFAWVLSVLFWRAMEAPGAERESVADTIITFMSHMLGEDRCLSPPFHG
jgi:AcrR family transcriptional regulator